MTRQPRTRAQGNTSPLAPEKAGDEAFALTRADLRALIDTVTNDRGIADTRLPCYLGTLQRDVLIDRMLSGRHQTQAALRKAMESE